MRLSEAKSVCNVSLVKSRDNHRSTFLGKAIKVAIASMAFLPGALWASPGGLDTTFGSGGRLIINSGYGLVTNTIAIQADEKWLTTGGPVLWRYFANGQIDTSFAGDGSLNSVFNGKPGANVPYFTLVQPDQKLVVGGFSGIYPDRKQTLSKILANGTFDAGFGTNGVVLNNPGAYDDVISSASVMPDGRIVVVGYSYTSSSSYQTFVARYLSNGTPDPEFNGTGSIVIGGDAPNSLGTAVVVQSDGRILIGGTLRPTNTPEMGVIYRLQANGSLDSSFGNGTGKVTLNASVVSLALTADDKIVMAGSRNVARYGQNGEIDSMFTPYSVPSSGVGASPTIRDMLLAPDGGILIVSNGYSSTVINTLTRLMPNGGVDAAWLTPVSSGYSAQELAVSPSGTIYTAGAGSATSSVVERHVANDNNNDGIADPWDLTPDPITFRVPAKPAGTMVTSDLVVVNGLGVNVKVPVLVRNAEFSINGSTSYQSRVGYVSNGDKLSIRYASGANVDVQVGGMHASSHNLPLILGQPVHATVVPVDTAPPLKIITVVPKAGNAHVPEMAKLVVNFASRIEPSSLNASTFGVICAGKEISAKVMLLGGHVGFLYPRAPLPSGTACTATVSTGVTGMKGERLPSDYRWSFAVHAKRVR